MSRGSMTSAQELSPLKAARRDKILEVAEIVFVENGFRGTTMEQIAKAVGMSKVTVYGYFKDKDAVFDAVSDRVATRLEAAVEEALQAGSTAEERISSALVAKHGIIFDLVGDSPFAKELISTKSRSIEDRFTALDRAITARLADVLASEGRPGEEARRLAHLIFSASLGIANASASKDEMRRDVSRLVQAMCQHGATGEADSG